MANLKKEKLGIGVSSAIAIILVSSYVLIPLEEPIIKKWDRDSLLVWEDFLGPRPLVTGYAAAISSKLYMEFDSAREGYLVYAGQDNQHSWVEEESYGSEEILKHEQYHFNITEIFARRANEMLDTMTNPDEQNAKRLLSEMIDYRKEMQQEYDDETEHGVNESMQNLWEYKIDKELMDFEEGGGIYTDRYSGLSVRFTSTPKIELDLDTNWLHKYVTVDKYPFLLEIMIVYDYLWDTASAREFVQKEVQRYEARDFSIAQTQWLGHETFEYEYIDTTNVFREFKWLIKDPYQYYIIFSAPKEWVDESFVLRARHEFLNSIEVLPQDDYWIKVYEEKNFETVETSLTDKEIQNYEKSGKGDEVRWVEYPGRSEYTLEYHRPIVYEDEVLIPYKMNRHDLEDIEAFIAIVNHRMYEQQVDSNEQIVSIKQEAFNKGVNDIHFGYVLKKDSAREAYWLYGSVANFTK